MIRLALLCLLLLPVTAQAQCVGNLINGCPSAANPLGTDLLLGWQNAQTPHTRAFQLQQIIAGGLPGAFSTLSATGIISFRNIPYDNAYAYSTPTTGGTVTFAPGQWTALIDPASTLAALTITLPSCAPATDGEQARYTVTQAVTALTVNAASGSVKGAPTTLATGSAQSYLCRGANSTWYPVD
jgi:hypothetical protein